MVGSRGSGQFGSGTPVDRFPDVSADELETQRSKGEEAALCFDETRDRLLELARRSHPLELLARMAMTTISSQARFGSSDYDPVLHVYHMEFFQAVALSEPFRTSYEESTLTDVTHEIIRLVNENAKAFRERELRTLTSDGRANAFSSLIDQVRVTTQTVRGPRHAFQTRRYLRDLADRLDANFLRELGCTLSALLDYVESLASELDKRLEGFRGRQRRWMSVPTRQSTIRHFEESNAKLKTSPEFQAAVAGSQSLQELRYRLLSVVEAQYAPMFMMAKPNDPALRTLVNRLSLTFGDVDASVIALLHLNNPVWRKPFIGLDADYVFWPNPQSLFAFLVEIVDDLVEPMVQLKTRVEKVKAEWLEQKLRLVLEAAFSSGKVLTKVCWKDQQGAGRETDALVLIDKVVAIFEAKSGRVSPPARRGAQDRLRREIRRLIVEPSEQSDALRAAISGGPVEVRCEQGKFELQSTEAREFVRVNILFDTIGTLSAHWPQLKEHGLVKQASPLAPTMSIFELETVLDALPNEIRRLHYLKRREEIECHGNYVADELDLLALHFDTSLSSVHLSFPHGGSGFTVFRRRLRRHTTIKAGHRILI